MILTERQMELQKIINDLRKQIELLESHRTVGLVNDKQYDETMGNIVKRVEELEKELGVKPEPLRAFDLMFKSGIEKFNEMMEVFKI